jgi:hypothetical protein
MIVAETCRQFLSDCGVDSGRLALEWVSAAEAPRFVDLITDYITGIKGKGPLGSAEGEAGKDVLKRRLSAAVKAAQARKPRTALGNLAKRLSKAKDYSSEAISEGVKAKVLPALRTARITEEIKLVLSGGPMDAGAIAGATGASGEEIDGLLATLAKRGLVSEKKGKWALA